MTQTAQSPLEKMLGFLQPLPSLGAMAGLFEDMKQMGDFIELINEYLPDKRAEIMAFNGTGDKIATFIFLFSERYFNLDDSWVQSIYENGFDDEEGERSLFDGLVTFIPVQVRNFGEDDYHFFENESKGRKLMLALLKCPTGDAGSRIPLVEAAGEIAGKDLADMMPAKGFGRGKLHTLLDHTDYAGLADFSDWVNHETGLWVMDFDFDMGYFDMPDWTRETVERLTMENELAGGKEKRINGVEEWLSSNPESHFKKLLSVLLQKQIPKRTLMEVFNEGED